jgi:hypothetical protein
MPINNPPNDEHGNLGDEHDQESTRSVMALDGRPVGQRRGVID